MVIRQAALTQEYIPIFRLNLYFWGLQTKRSPESLATQLPIKDQYNCEKNTVLLMV